MFFVLFSFLLINSKLYPGWKGNPLAQTTLKEENSNMPPIHYVYYNVYLNYPKLHHIYEKYTHTHTPTHPPTNQPSWVSNFPKHKSASWWQLSTSAPKQKGSLDNWQPTHTICYVPGTRLNVFYAYTLLNNQSSIIAELQQFLLDR